MSSSQVIYISIGNPQTTYILHFSPSIDLDLSMHFIYMFDKMILYRDSFGHVE